MSFCASEIDIFILIILINVYNQLRVVQKAILSVDYNLDDMDPKEADRLAKIRIIKCIQEINQILR